MVLLLIACTAIADQPMRDQGPLPSKPIELTAPPKSPRTLKELLGLPREELERLDPGLINLLCAEALPGSEDLDIQKSLAALDSLAKLVEIETRRRFSLFKKSPELFYHSLAYFRMQMLGEVLVNGLRIRYNPERSGQSQRGLKSREDEDHFFADSKDLFVHGLLSQTHFGTCASMPFLYLAIGWRLGYPVHLAAGEEHFYVRYEEENGQHLNVETTTVSRFNTPPDEFYRSECNPSRTDLEIQQSGWLRPLKNREVLAHSLLTRIACLRSNGRHDEELKTWDIAAAYLPPSDGWRATITHRKGQATVDRHTQRWNELWNEIGALPIPRGNGFAYFRDKQIRLRLFLNSTTNLAAVEKALSVARSDLGDFLGPSTEGRTIADASAPEKPAGVQQFRFGEKEIAIPADLFPPISRGALPQDLVKQVFEKHLNSADAILAFVWNHYEQATLQKAQMERARIGALMHRSGPPPILLPRDEVPTQYWNGFPPALAARLQNMTQTGMDEPVLLLWAIRDYWMQEMNPTYRGGQGQAAILASTPYLRAFQSALDAASPRANYPRIPGEDLAPRVPVPFQRPILLVPREAFDANVPPRSLPPRGPAETNALPQLQKTNIE